MEFMAEEVVEEDYMEVEVEEDLMTQASVQEAVVVARASPPLA